MGSGNRRGKAEIRPYGEKARLKEATALQSMGGSEKFGVTKRHTPCIQKTASITGCQLLSGS
jgi:hypothetical protein